MVSIAAVLVFINTLICVRGDVLTSEPQWSIALKTVNNKLENMEVRLAEKNRRIRALENRVTDLETKDGALKDLPEEMSTLKEELSKKDQRIEYLEKMLADLIEAFRQEEEHSTQGQGEISQNREVQENIDVNTKNVQGLAKIKRVSPIIPIKTVAFHVYLSATTFNNDAIIKYNIETLDIGNGYNTQTGVYVVPVTGTYVLTWTTAVYHHGFTQSSLFVNGTLVGATETDTEREDEVRQSTGLVVCALNIGEPVYVKSVRHASGHPLSVEDARNTFSGWILQK